MTYRTTSEIKGELTAAVEAFRFAKQQLTAFQKRNIPEILRIEMIAETLIDQEDFHRAAIDKIHQTARRYLDELNEINDKGDFLMAEKEAALELVEELTDELEGDHYITDSIVELATGQR